MFRDQREQLVKSRKTHQIMGRSQERESCLGVKGEMVLRKLSMAKC